MKALIQPARTKRVACLALFGIVLWPAQVFAQSGCSLTPQTSIGTRWSCLFPPLCVADYNAFPQRASPYRQPISELQLWEQILRIAVGRVPQVTPSDLRSTLLEALNIRFLVDGLNSRPAIVTTVSDELDFDATGSPYRQRELLFHGDYVGTFQGLLLTPPAVSGDPVRYPVVLALHGHAETAEIYRDTYFARDYPKNGLGILILTFRAMDPWLGEHEAWRTLILNGFNLMGLRVYEALLGLKYLACNPEVQKIGLIGHSGGSSTGNLVARIAPSLIQAYVSDYQIDYAKLDALEPYHCETVPRVYPYHGAINNFATLAPLGISAYQVPYGYTGVSQNILAFFAKNLGP
jgi:hypothetical protein